MEQSQTPGEHHPEYDAKKTIPEKLTAEGLDHSKISVKLKEAHDVIQRDCDACILTHPDDIQDFWDDHTFSNLYYYCLENVETKLRKNGSSPSDISDAVKKEKRAILVAKEACTTDAERAESLRIKNLGGDENPYEDYVYEKFDVDQKCGSKDWVVLLQERLDRVGANESEISKRVRKVDAAIQRVFSVCVFTDKEKQIFRCDIIGKYTGELLFIMSCRLRKMGHDEVAVEEMSKVACDAIRDAQNSFSTCMNWHSDDLEETNTEYGFRDRIADLREQMILRDIDTSEISMRLKEAEEVIQRVFSISALTDKEKQMFRCDINGDYTRDIESLMPSRLLKKGYDAVTVEEMSTRTKDAIQDANLFFRACIERYGVDLKDAYTKCGSKERIVDFEERLICEGADKSDILKRLEAAEEAIQRVFSICEFTDRERQIFKRDINGKYSADLVYSMLRRLSRCGYDVDELKDMKKRAYDATEAATNAFRIYVSRHQADDEKDVGSSKRPMID